MKAEKILNDINILYRSTLKKKNKMLNDMLHYREILNNRDISHKEYLSVKEDLIRIDRELQDLEHYLQGVYDAREEIFKYLKGK